MSTILHPITKKELDIFYSHPAHFLMLVGPNGIGKTFVAQELIAKLLETNLGELNSNPYYHFIEASGETINIETVRDLQRALKLRTTGVKKIRRGIIIEHGENLSKEAQNALLKTLEEPAPDTVIIITVNNMESLLPTIYSRAQLIKIKVPPYNIIEEKLIELQHPVDKINAAIRVSNGLPGLTSAILAEESSHPLVGAVKNAKEILRLKRFQRLLLINELTGDRKDTEGLLLALLRIARSGLEQSAVDNKLDSLSRWQLILGLVIRAQAALKNNANPKLVLTDLFLSI